MSRLNELRTLDLVTMCSTCMEDASKLVLQPHLGEAAIVALVERLQMFSYMLGEYGARTHMPVLEVPNATE